MNRLLLLNEEIVQQASRGTLRPALPIKATRQKLPILPADVWRPIDGSLKKTFKFDDVIGRNTFLFRLLSYEQEKGHNAVIVVREDSVAVSVTTHMGSATERRVTELDREYTHAADMIFSEIAK